MKIFDLVLKKIFHHGIQLGKYHNRTEHCILISYYTLELLIILQDKEMDGGDYKERNRRGYIPDKNHFLSFYV